MPEPEAGGVQSGASDPADVLAVPDSGEGAVSGQSVLPGALAESGNLGTSEEPNVENPVAEDTSPGPLTEQIPAVVETPDPALENRSGLAEATDIVRLQISFIDDCWVQVSDATGKRLVNALLRNGDEIDVSGQAPLRGVIGAVDAVELDQIFHIGQ